MAMLISKFHRLIQSKLVWAVILVIIVFSFVIWGTQMPTKSDRDQASSPGTLKGEAVDAKSILDILTMAAGHGSELELHADGPDALDALRHLRALFHNRFR